MRNLKKLVVPIALLFTCSSNAFAQDDVIFRALKDEMDRSLKQLKIGGHEAPYFLSYTVKDKDVVRIAGSFGAIDSKNIDRDRDLNVDVRVGDYDLRQHKIWRRRAVWRNHGRKTIAQRSRHG